jgi:hypothetical protein
VKERGGTKGVAVPLVPPFSQGFDRINVCFIIGKAGKSLPLGLVKRRR